MDYVEYVLFLRKEIETKFAKRTFAVNGINFQVSFLEKYLGMAAGGQIFNLGDMSSDLEGLFGKRVQVITHKDPNLRYFYVTALQFCFDQNSFQIDCIDRSQNDYTKNATLFRKSDLKEPSAFSSTPSKQGSRTSFDSNISQRTKSPPWGRGACSAADSEQDWRYDLR